MPVVRHTALLAVTAVILSSLLGCASPEDHQPPAAAPVVYAPMPVGPGQTLAAERDGHEIPGGYCVDIEQDGRIVQPDENRIVHLDRRPFTMAYGLPRRDTAVCTSFDADATAYTTLQQRGGRVPDKAKEADPLLGGPAQGMAEADSPTGRIFIHNDDRGEGYHYWDRESGRFDSFLTVMTDGKPSGYVARRKVKTFSMPGSDEAQRPIASYPKKRLYVISYADTERPCLFFETGHPPEKAYEIAVHPALMDQSFIIEFNGDAPTSGK